MFFLLLNVQCNPSILVKKVKSISVETSSKKHGSFVGFTAAINTLEFYDSGETIEFSKVIYNDGGHFNPATNR